MPAQPLGQQRQARRQQVPLPGQALAVRLAPVPALPLGQQALRQAPQGALLQTAARWLGLRGQEREHGFQEKMQRAESFFRKGKVGDWRDRLTPEQAACVIAAHGAVMRRFGYLDDLGSPIY